MTKNARRFSDSGSLPALVLLAALLAGVAPAVETFAQVEEDLTGALDEYRNVLALADAAFENLELSEALALYSQVIDGYKTGRLQASTPLTRQMVGKSYEGRARTLANLGRAEEAEADFEALVRFDVNWALDRKTISPKIIAIFDEVRGNSLGIIAVKTEPPGANVFLNGDLLGISPVFDKQVPTGTYTLTVESAGFEKLVEQVLLEGGDRLEKELYLVANARGVLITTTPVGVTVTVDGVERGSTFGTSGPDYADAAAGLGLSPLDLSSPLLLDNLAPGQHLLKLEKECHETRTFTLRVDLDPNDHSPIRFEPMALEPSLGSLRLASTPSGAEVLVDGKRAGITPITVADLCSGGHEVVMRGAQVGQWRGRVDVSRNRVSRVNEPLRRTLVVSGLVPDGGAGDPLIKAVIATGQFNVIVREEEIPAADMVRVGKETGADLIAIARPSGGPFEQTLDITLHAARYPEIRDSLVLSLDDQNRVREFAEELAGTMRLDRPWLGLKTVEIHRAVNPIVILVQPGSPAEAAGVRPGDRVVSLGGHPAGIPADLDDAIASLDKGAIVSLTLQRHGDAPHQVSITTGATPVIRPVLPAGTLKAPLAADLSFQARIEVTDNTGSTQRNAAFMNLALLLMGEGEFKAALRDALDLTMLPDGPGISSGTIEFMRGLCLESLQRPDDARARYQTAADQRDATLWSNDGPPVWERALRRLASF